MHSQSQTRWFLWSVVSYTGSSQAEPAILTGIDDEEIPLLVLVYLPNAGEQHPGDGVLRTT